MVSLAGTGTGGSRRNQVRVPCPVQLTESVVFVPVLVTLYWTIVESMGVRVADGKGTSSSMYRAERGIVSDLLL